MLAVLSHIYLKTDLYFHPHTDAHMATYLQINGPINVEYVTKLSILTESHLINIFCLFYF